MSNLPDNPWADGPKHEPTERYIPAGEAVRNLADAFSEDILRTPGAHLLAEVAEDRGNAGDFARDFDRIVVQAERRRRKEQRSKRLHAIFVGPFRWVRKPIMVGAAALVAIAGVNVAYMAGYLNFGHAPWSSENSTPQVALIPAADGEAKASASEAPPGSPAQPAVRRMEVLTGGDNTAQRLAQLETRQKQAAEQLAAIQQERDLLLREQQARAQRARTETAPPQAAGLVPNSGSQTAALPTGAAAPGGAAQPAPKAAAKENSKCGAEVASMTAIEGDLSELQKFVKGATCDDVRTLARAKIANLEQAERTCTAEDLRRSFLLERVKATTDHARLADYKQQAAKLEQDATCAQQRPYLAETVATARVKLAQADLKRLSCYTSEPDGVLNDATREAVKLFLGGISRPDNGGEVDENLLARLGDRANAGACGASGDGRVAAARRPPARPVATRLARPGTPAPASDQVQAFAPGAAKALPGDTTLARLTGFAAQYDGGDCFFLKNVAIGDTFASLEGLGATVAPFEKFDGAFRQVAGFEADIGVRLVTLPQCPAVNFLRQVRGSSGNAPILGVATSGQQLTGTIKDRANAQIELLVVSPSGTVLSYTSALKGDDPKSFEMGIPSAGTTSSDPLLLIAIAASKSLDALRPGGTIAAKDFFTRLAREATQAGVTLSATSQYVSPTKTPPVQIRSLPTARGVAPSSSNAEGAR